MSELSPAARLTAFVAGLLVVLGAAVGVGRLTGDVAEAQDDPPAAVGAGHSAGHSAGHGDHGHGASGEVVGTSASDGGLRLEALDTVLPARQVTPFSFRVLDEDGRAVIDPDVEQEKPLHLLVVDRDLSRIAHLHPEVDPGGSWTTDLYLAPGSYRAVADLVVDGRRHALAVDLTAPGPLAPRPLPLPQDSVTVDGVTVQLERDDDRVTARVTDAAGRALEPEPYLGAAGHLTGFRAGDLAYVHAHPEGDDLAFELPLPGPGSYRLFLEVRTGGVVRTFGFTVEEPS